MFHTMLVLIYVLFLKNQIVFHKGNECIWEWFFCASHSESTPVERMSKDI